MKFGIIGGSGLDSFGGMQTVRRQAVPTPYGEPSSLLTLGKIDGRELVFLARHGDHHEIAPHEINYRANLWALKHAEVDAVVSVATVGGIAEGLRPGTLVLPDQIIDYTSGRASTYFEGAGQPVSHIDFTWPYDSALRSVLASVAAELGQTLIAHGTYGCAQGPRLETAAEIRRMERDGCDLVGMTGMPEAALARELSLPYATLAVVVNHAAGKGESVQKISHDAIGATLQGTMMRVCEILAHLVRRKTAPQA
ncbi:MAG: S-methyl-5'-thioinosine phosphorylase [Quisquiliibacterium sp.]